MLTGALQKALPKELQKVLQKKVLWEVRDRVAAKALQKALQKEPERLLPMGQSRVVAKVMAEAKEDKLSPLAFGLELQVGAKVP